MAVYCLQDFHVEIIAESFYDNTLQSRHLQSAVLVGNPDVARVDALAADRDLNTTTLSITAIPAGDRDICQRVCVVICACYGYLQR